MVTAELTVRGVAFWASLQATLTVPFPLSMRLEIVISILVDEYGYMIAVSAEKVSVISALQTTFSCAIRSAAVLATVVTFVFAS